MRPLLLVFLLGCSTADAQPSRSPDLGVRWDTTEGIWRGTWVRRGTANVFTARWDCQQWPAFTGTVEVTVDGRAVTVNRRDDDHPFHGKGNRCVYRGKLAADGTITGTSQCSNSSYAVYPWRARIVRQ
jgi:hypothetical protein